jgi:hypothetical protein
MTDFDQLYQQVLTHLGGPVEVETPQLGRATFPRPNELYAALNYLRLAEAQAYGAPAAGVITIGYDRGLGPGRGGYA